MGVTSTTAPRRSTPYYAPGEPSARLDGQFTEKVAHCLLANFGRPVHVEEEVGGDPWVVCEAINTLTRYGAEVLAVKGVPGYVMLDWAPPVAPDADRAERVTRLLLSSFGATINVAGLLHEDPAAVDQDVRALELTGLVIDRTGAGYTACNWVRPKRWTHFTRLAREAAELYGEAS